MRSAFGATLLCAVACGLRDVQGPPGEEQVVVQGVLNAQFSEQVLWIERTIPAGDPLQSGLRPLAVPPSRVEVRDSTGAVFPFHVDAANAARFVAVFTPIPGHRYDLLVEAGPIELTATTRVPDAVTIVDPAADTVMIARNVTLPVKWAGPPRLMRVAFVNIDGISYPQWVSADTAANVLLPAARTSTVWVLAVDSATVKFLDPFVPLVDPSLSGQLRGNINGGAGVFTAVASDHVVVQVR